MKRSVACSDIRAPPRGQRVDQRVDDAQQPVLDGGRAPAGLLAPRRSPGGTAAGGPRRRVDRPLEVLRAAVVLLGALGQLRRRPCTCSARERRRSSGAVELDARAARLVGDELDVLVGELGLDDLEHHLVDQEAIRASRCRRRRSRRGRSSTRSRSSQRSPLAGLSVIATPAASAPTIRWTTTRHARGSAIPRSRR